MALQRVFEGGVIFELAHLPEPLEARADLIFRERLEALCGKGFDVVARQHAAKDHGLAQMLEADFVQIQAGEITGEPSREAVACSCRVVNIFQRVCAAGEELVLSEKEATMLSFFYRNKARPELADGGPGANERCLPGELPSLAVVEDEHVDPLEEGEEVVLRCVDPEVHGVGDDKAWPLRLIEHMALEARSDIGQKDDRGATVRAGELWRKGFEDVEREAACLARVKIPVVFARPAEGRPFDHLQPFEVDPAPVEKLDILLRKIVPDDADEIYATEEAGGNGRVRGRAAELVGMLFEWCFDSIKGNGADNENRHDALVM